MAEDKLHLNHSILQGKSKPQRLSTIVAWYCSPPPTSLKWKRLLQVCVTCALKQALLPPWMPAPDNRMASEELINLAGWVKVSWWAIQDSILHPHPLLQQVPAPVLRPQPCSTINVAIPISKAVHSPRLPCQSLAWTPCSANVTMAEDLPAYQRYCTMYFFLFASAIIANHVKGETTTKKYPSLKRQCDPCMCSSRTTDLTLCNISACQDVPLHLAQQVCGSGFPSAGTLV